MKKYFYIVIWILLLIFIGTVGYLCFSPNLPINLPADNHQISHIIIGKALVAYVPFQEIDQLGFWLNILMAVPLGIIIAVITKYQWKLKLLTLIGIVFGCLIELTQFILDNLLLAHRWVDINDVIANSLGFIIGYSLIKLINAKLFSK
ncbi:VanZ family protein [Lactobacillus sp. ESL0791]|uniref:VanZ family protein n=1 Tax=Lactobacillus sp. ESL0791 TaxID=2983234 RepID=UPI0023FA18BA|nr:VanZ family protein [Lactobacillus sp. ESL0791]MDF7639821.1 VanZ family protein [Lactobacillus sp. ESL0791]